MTEFFKVKNGLPNQILSELFDWRKIDFSLEAVYTISYGLRSLRYLAPKISNIILAYIRNVNNLSDFSFENKILDT